MLLMVKLPFLWHLPALINSLTVLQSHPKCGPPHMMHSRVPEVRVLVLLVPLPVFPLHGLLAFMLSASIIVLLNSENKAESSSFLIVVSIVLFVRAEVSGNE